MPRRLGVIGAGPGGVEFAYLYRVFGAEEVILVESLSRLLPREDAELGELVRRSLQVRGIRVETGACLAPELSTRQWRGQQPSKGQVLLYYLIGSHASINLSWLTAGEKYAIMP